MSKETIIHGPDTGDIVSFGTGLKIILMSPFVGWILNVLTAVLVAFLSRLLWEFARPVVEDMVQSKSVQGFFSVFIKKKPPTDKDNQAQ